MSIGENVKWIIIEVAQEPAGPQVFVAPPTLNLEPGFIGELVWFVYTEGWQLAPTNAIVFRPDPPFAGDPQPDPSRPRCWSTATVNESSGTFHYSIAVQRLSDGAIYGHHDPVVENDPPPSQAFVSARPLSAAS